MKKPIAYFITLLLLIFTGCDDSIDDVTGSEEDNTLTLDTRSITPALRDNARIFLFDGDNRNGADGQYFREVLGITRTDNKLSASVDAGLWNIGLVSCEDNISGTLKTPVRGYAPEDVLMWKTESVGGKLPDMPEICTALIENVNIVSGGTHSVATQFVRHVGMVRVQLKDGVGFSTGSGHTVYLKEVPTSLSWGGSLYPDKDNPDHSGNVAMVKDLTFLDAGGGRQKSNPVDFIVPAHLSANANDTTTHQFTLGVKFTTVGGTAFEKEVKVQEVPRDNKILLVNIIAKGGVEVKTEVADWDLKPSIDNPKLYEMVVGGYNSQTQEWTFTLTMYQERNWWITLGGAHPEYFEFVDGSDASGQEGISTIRVKRSSQHPGGNQSATLSLHISGYNNVVENWTIQD